MGLLILILGSPGTMARAQGEAPAAARPRDGYDVGAAAVNVLWVPFKVGVCGMAGGLAGLVFVATLGAARNWSGSVLEEACVHHWLIDGDDLRPMPALAPPPDRPPGS